MSRLFGSLAPLMLVLVLTISRDTKDLPEGSTAQGKLVLGHLDKDGSTNEHLDNGEVLPSFDPFVRHSHHRLHTQITRSQHPSHSQLGRSKYKSRTSNHGMITSSFVRPVPVHLIRSSKHLICPLFTYTVFGDSGNKSGAISISA